MMNFNDYHPVMQDAIRGFLEALCEEVYDNPELYARQWEIEKAYNQSLNG